MTEIPPAQLALLEQLSTAESPHSGRTLFEHLCGTRALLAAWGNDDELCAAGLFHSIYGTEYYRIESATLDRRPDVATVIGPRAEELAFLFCVTDRRGFFEQADAAAPRLRDRVAGTDVVVTAETVTDLIELEIANVVEQIDPTSVKPGTVSRLEEMLHGLPPGVSEGARAALADLAEQSGS